MAAGAIEHTRRIKLPPRGCAVAAAKPLRVAVLHWGQVAALDWNDDAVLASGSCGSCNVSLRMRPSFDHNLGPDHRLGFEPARAVTHCLHPLFLSMTHLHLCLTSRPSPSHCRAPCVAPLCACSARPPTNVCARMHAGPQHQALRRPHSEPRRAGPAAPQLLRVRHPGEI